MGCGGSKGTAPIDAEEDGANYKEEGNEEVENEPIDEPAVQDNGKGDVSANGKEKKVIMASSPTPLTQKLIAKAATDRKYTPSSKTKAVLFEEDEALVSENKAEEPPYERVPPPNVVGESTNKSNMLHMSKRMKNYKNDATIRLIDFDTFKKQKEIPRFPGCQSMTEEFDAEKHNYMDSIIVFVSHCWISGWDGKGPDGTVLSRDHDRNWRGIPHPDNKKNDKFKLIVEGVESVWIAMAPTFSKCYLWIDYSCINQEADPAGELGFLDLIVRVCDFMVTPVVDYKWNDWKVEKSFQNWFEAYKAQAFKGTRYSYLSRAWCRVEMLFASTIPFVDHEGEVRTNRFKGALKESASKGIRSHFVYGTKENKEGSSGRVLPPLAHSFLSDYNPLSGYLSVASDMSKIESLMREIKPYLKEDTEGLEMIDSESDSDEKEEATADTQGEAGSEEAKSSKASRKIKRMAEKRDAMLKSGEYTGKGKYKYGDGNTFEGTFVGGKREGPGKFVYGNGDTYQGEYKDDRREGHGKMTFGSNVYQGNWKNNMRHGLGNLTRLHPPSTFVGEFKDDFKVTGVETFHGGGKYEGSYHDDLKSGIGSFTFANGDTFSGEWVEDEMHGVGKYEYSSGSAYEGFFERGKMHGKGTYTSKQGIFEGLFENDLKHGRGRYVWPSGEVYEGDYLDNARHGSGIYTYANGDVYKGDWTADKQTGQGTFIGKEGGMQYTGGFVNGDFEGMGVLDMRGRRYEGAFHANAMHGNGTLKYQNGNIYVGSFEKGQRSGEGHLIYAKGDEYIGPWTNDKMQGLGKFTFSNGDVYEGEFREGKRHGRGCKTIASSGEKKEGLWSDDKYHGPGNT